MMHRSILASIAVVAALALATYGAALAQQGGPTTRPTGATQYPLDTCPVMGVKLDSKGKPITKEYDGRTVKVCCARCVRTFEQNPEKFHAKMDKLIVGEQLDAYPLTTCVVSGEALGEMGDPVNFVHRPENRLVRFCCEGCVEAFRKDPVPFLAKIDEAAKKN